MLFGLSSWALGKRISWYENQVFPLPCGWITAVQQADRISFWDSCPNYKISITSGHGVRWCRLNLPMSSLTDIQLNPNAPCTKDLPKLTRHLPQIYPKLLLSSQVRIWSHMFPDYPIFPICSRSGFDKKTLELSGLHLGHCLLQSGWTFYREGAGFADQNGCSLSGL